MPKPLLEVRTRRGRLLFEVTSGPDEFGFYTYEGVGVGGYGSAISALRMAQDLMTVTSVIEGTLVDEHNG